PVLNEREQTADANREGSVMHRMLALKQKHPLPDQPILSDSFDFSLDRNQQCTTIEEFPRFEKKFPLWGMPYGLPGLDPQESRLMMRWIETGAASTPTPPLPEQHLQA